MILITEFIVFTFFSKFPEFSPEKFRNFGNDKPPKIPEIRNRNHYKPDYMKRWHF